MSTIPTESRIFADRYCREAKRIEALHAALISPGTTTWGAALDALFDRMEAVGSSIKQAAFLKQAITSLNSIAPAEAMHIGFTRVIEWGEAMQRRSFLTLIGGAAAWPLAARAQQPERVRRISKPRTMRYFRPSSGRSLQRLGQLGWTIGRNVRIEA